MTSNDHFPAPDADPWGAFRELSGIVGRLFFVACAGSVLVASLISAPHIFYSYHVSHFAVLYVMALATLAAFPDWSILTTFWRLLGFVTVLGVARIIVRHHLETNFLDWIADLTGILGGLAPVAVQRLRELQIERHRL